MSQILFKTQEDELKRIEAATDVPQVAGEKKKALDDSPEPIFFSIPSSRFSLRTNSQGAPLNSIILESASSLSQQSLTSRVSGTATLFFQLTHLISKTRPRR